MSGIYKGVYPMEPTEQKRFDALYEQHLRGLKLHGYSASTIDVYYRAGGLVQQLMVCLVLTINPYLLADRFTGP
jgi:hypothetical protein